VRLKHSGPEDNGISDEMESESGIWIDHRKIVDVCVYVFA
jgi:hypothetical protein